MNMDVPVVLFVPVDAAADWRAAAALCAPDALVTSDPEAAARYGFPRQHITVVGPESAEPWLGWFAARFPRLHVDRLLVDAPVALADAWARRSTPEIWPRWWSTRETAIGATLSADAGIAQLAALTAGRATAVRVPVGLSALLPRVLAEQAPATTVILCASPSTQRKMQPLEFVTGIATSLGAWYRTGVRALELCPEPNLPRGGWGVCWSTVDAFADWWLQTGDVLRRLFPEIRLGWPGLAPSWMARRLGGSTEEAWASSAATAARADWIGVRAHWRDTHEILAETGGLRPWLARRAWPEHLLIVTGFGPVDAAEPEPVRAEQCARFVDQLQALAGVGAAFTDGPAGSWWASAGRVSGVALRLGERAGYSVASS